MTGQLGLGVAVLQAGFDRKEPRGSIWEFPKIGGTFFGAPYNKE